nr:MAG TPA: hypothetical protein [Caudoviricetes sp.]
MSPVMWKTPQPVENLVENSVLVDNPVENFHQT